MSLKDQITKETITAAKAKDLKKVKVLRFLQAAIKNKEIALRPEKINEQTILSVIKKEIKQTQESLEYYKKAEGYESDIAEEEYKLNLFQAYLPEPLSESQIKSLIEESIEKIKATSLKDMGQVMKYVMTQSQGAVDAKVLSEMIRNRLQNL